MPKRAFVYLFNIFFPLCIMFPFLSYLIGHCNVFDVFGFGWLLVMAIAMLCHAWLSFAFEPKDNVLILLKKKENHV